MRVGVEVPIHEAIIFDFGTANTNGFLEQHSACILLVRQQLVDSLPIPFEFACGGRNALLLQPSGNFTQAISAEKAGKYPADNGSLVRINDQLAARVGVVSITPTLGHLGGTVTKAFLQTVSNESAFFDVHVNLSFP